MVDEFMEEYRQRCLVAEALGLRPAHDPPLKRDPRFEEAWNEVVIARRQQDARTANVRDLESAPSAVPSQMQSRLPETSKHDQVGLEAEVYSMHRSPASTLGLCSSMADHHVKTI